MAAIVQDDRTTPPGLPGDDFVRFTVRLPTPQHRALLDLASAGDRTLNAQVLRLLRRGMEAEGAPEHPTEPATGGPR